MVSKQLCEARLIAAASSSKIELDIAARLFGADAEVLNRLMFNRDAPTSALVHIVSSRVREARIHEDAPFTYAQLALLVTHEGARTEEWYKWLCYHRDYNDAMAVYVQYVEFFQTCFLLGR